MQNNPTCLSRHPVVRRHPVPLPCINPPTHRKQVESKERWEIVEKDHHEEPTNQDGAD